MNRLLLLSLVAGLLAALACTAPMRDYDVDQIRAVADLEELMWVQATIADPRFALAQELTPLELDDGDYEDFLDMSLRLQACAEKLVDFSALEGFDAYALQLGERASSLEDVIELRDPGAVLESTLAIKATCAACHDDYR